MLSHRQLRGSFPAPGQLPCWAGASGRAPRQMQRGRSQAQRPVPKTTVRVHACKAKDDNN